MLNKKWKKFDRLTETCYANMIGANKDSGCWLQAFDLLIETVREERITNPNFAPELALLEDELYYSCDISGWLEDCLDEMDMRKEYSTLLQMCDALLNVFSWPEYTGSELRFRKSSALAALGKTEEAAAFCNSWIQREPDNIMAATAGVYAFIGIKAFADAQKLVTQFILNPTECDDENCTMFVAASVLYQVTGKKKEKKIIDKALEEYEEYLENFFLLSEDDEDDDTFWEEDELPFN